MQRLRCVSFRGKYSLLKNQLRRQRAPFYSRVTRELFAISTGDVLCPAGFTKLDDSAIWTAFCDAVTTAVGIPGGITRDYVPSEVDFPYFLGVVFCWGKMAVDVTFSFPEVISRAR